MSGEMWRRQQNKANDITEVIFKIHIAPREKRANGKEQHGDQSLTETPTLKALTGAYGVNQADFLGMQKLTGGFSASRQNSRNYHSGWRESLWPIYIDRTE